MVIYCDSLISTTHDQYIRGFYLAMNIIKNAHHPCSVQTRHFIISMLSHLLRFNDKTLGLMFTLTSWCEPHTSCEWCVLTPIVY